MKILRLDLSSNISAISHQNLFTRRMSSAPRTQQHLLVDDITAANPSNATGVHATTGDAVGDVGSTSDMDDASLRAFDDGVHMIVENHRRGLPAKHLLSHARRAGRTLHSAAASRTAGE